MPQLLLELFSEEIPARMQAQAARDLERMARESLARAGFLPEAVASFAGPRRLTLVVEGLPVAQPDRVDERKGPRVGAPDAAIEGFLRSAGLTRDQLIERDGVWFASIARSGRPTGEIIAETVDEIVRGFPWPKSMKWGTGSLRWVRPLQRILCVFDGEVVPFSIDGVASSEWSEGHRFMGSRAPFRARDFDDYARRLRADFVVLDPAERKARILDGARTACFARNLELVEDEGLLDEVAGLAEWPTPILGDMDPSFLDLPPEVIRTSMRTHQKYFTVRDPATGALAPHFLTVANIEAVDGGATIAAGNARVLSARLNDARFFWNEDRKKENLQRWLKKLEGVTFQAELGSMRQRIGRIRELALDTIGRSILGEWSESDRFNVSRAVTLSKLDLVSGMVAEFPELQGIMGSYYARHFGFSDDIVTAIRDHYKPLGPNDSIPSSRLASAIALADKFDTLTGFWFIGEKPTGSRDPYGLRRAALGVIRIVVEQRVRMSLLKVLDFAFEQLMQDVESDLEIDAFLHINLLPDELISEREKTEFSERAQKQAVKRSKLGKTSTPRKLELIYDLLAFLADRLKVLLREQGKRHDLVDAVFALGDDDLVLIVARVEALDGFLTTEDGANLLAGYKRATNILKAEEKKGPLPSGSAERLSGAPAQEIALIDALSAAEPGVAAALAAEDFSAAMRSLAGLRAPVDAFFDKVLVNSQAASERDNRLRLLAQVRDAMSRVADFSLIAG